MSHKVIPGPGALQSLRLGVQFQTNYIPPLEMLFKEYGDIVQLGFGPAKIILLFHPDDIEHVLKSNAKNYVKGDDLKELEPILGKGLLNSEGQEWLDRRRMLAPEFQHRKVDFFYPIMKKNCERMLHEWARQEEPFNTSPSITKMTYAIAGECFFGVHNEETSDVVYEAVDLAARRAVQRMVDLVKVPLWTPFPSYIRANRAIRELNKIVYDIIESRRNKVTSEVDVLSRLTQVREGGKSLTTTQIRDEVMTLLLAGHETTANALAWTLYLLAQHPEVQEQLRDEVNALMSGGFPTLEEIKNLKFAKMVFEESLRLYTPVAGISRKAIADDDLRGYKIKAGMNVEPCQWVTHRHPDFWPEPLKFKPERFAEGQTRHPFAYFPFAGGPRECIGKHMAMMEGISIIASIVKNFRFELVPGYEVGISPMITVRPSPGVTLKVTPLNKDYKSSGDSHVLTLL